jgi:hypothetical protein
MQFSCGTVSVGRVTELLDAQSSAIEQFSPFPTVSLPVFLELSNSTGYKSGIIHPAVVSTIADDMAKDRQGRVNRSHPTKLHPIRGHSPKASVVSFRSF